MIDRRLIDNFDWPLLIAVLMISAIGVTLIYRATHDQPTLYGHLYIRQIEALVLGLIIMLITICIDYKTIAKNAYFLYIINIGVLIYLLYLPGGKSGIKRWICLGLIFQPLSVQKK